MRLDINISEDYVAADTPEEGNYLGLVRAALRDHFPQVTGAADKRALYQILSIGASDAVEARVKNDPRLLVRKSALCAAIG